jgi:hypothetical protein
MVAEYRFVSVSQSVDDSCEQSKIINSKIYSHGRCLADMANNVTVCLRKASALSLVGKKQASITLCLLLFALSKEQNCAVGTLSGRGGGHATSAAIRQEQKRRRAKTLSHLGRPMDSGKEIS